MGYTKVTQYGEITQIIHYEKSLPQRRKPPSKLLATRLHDKLLKKDVTEHYRKIKPRPPKKVRFISDYSIYRTRNSFFMLCHHNNYHASSLGLLTLTFAYDVTYPLALIAQQHFLQSLRKHYGQQIEYISVPELTKKNRFHFHLLIYNLPAGAGINERNTRNFQRLYRHGYVHFDFASNRSKRIAGYMAKYMAKSLSDPKTSTWRAYNCSRGIKKITSFGSHTLDFTTDFATELKQRTVYKTKYLGNAEKLIYNIKEV